MQDQSIGTNLFTDNLHREYLEESILMTEDVVGSWEFLDETRWFTDQLKRRGVNVKHIYSPTTIVDNKPVECRLATYDENSIDRISQAMRGKTMFVYCAMRNRQTGERRVRFAAV